MFEAHKAKKAEEQFQQHLADWTRLREDTAHLLALAQGYQGEAASEGLILKPGERLIAAVTEASLIEQRTAGGHWQGGSSGVSVPIGSLGGHAIRYHVGRTSGHYVRGTPTATAIDTGNLFITDQRAVFEGARQTRECLFSKLIGVQFGDDGTAAFSVSNRQKPTVVHYGRDVAGWVHFRVDLATARFRGTVPTMVAQLQAQLAQIDQSKPVAPRAIS